MTSSDATIRDVQATAYRVPTDQPEADGTLAWDSTTIVVVTVAAGSTVGTGWTYGPAACAAVVSELLGPVVTGRPVLDVGGCWQTMVDTVRNAGRAGVAGYAISAVDVALWDLKARLLDLPLHRLLGAVRGEVPLYGSGGFTTYDPHALAAQLTGWVEGQGFARVKIKIGESWGTRASRDLDRVRQAREVVGDDVELYVDANGAYTPKQAIRLADSLTEHGVSWFEEPVSSDDLAGLSQVCGHIQPDVAAGEYGSDLTYFRRMCAAGAVDCLQADATRCGGITEWLRVAAVAAAHHLQISGHCAPHVHLHAAAATPNLRHLEWFHDHVRIEHLLFDGGLQPAGGALRPRDSVHGHGLTLSAEHAAPFRIA